MGNNGFEPRKPSAPVAVKLIKAVWSLFSPAIVASLLAALAGANVAVYALHLPAADQYRNLVLAAGGIGAVGGLIALWLSIGLSRHHTESQPLGCLILLLAAALLVAGLFFKFEGYHAYVTASWTLLLVAGGLAYHSGGGWRGA